jgi:hypothetical protein
MNRGGGPDVFKAVVGLTRVDDGLTGGVLAVQVVQLLQRNILENGVGSCCRTSTLDWTQEAARQALALQQWDVVLAADVCYVTR